MLEKSFVVILVCVLTASVAKAQSDDVYLTVRQNCDQSHSRVIQGKPGKKGPVGDKGDKGIKGQQGHKGEPGLCDNHDVMTLNERIRILTEELANSSQSNDRLEGSLQLMNEQVQKLERGLKVLYDSDWYNPGNGYLYKLIAAKASWHDSRDACQVMGGDLAVHGMKNRTTRKNLLTEMKIKYDAWIGLNDEAEEGRFVWVDGSASSSENAHWYANEPNNAGGEEDCAQIYHAHNFLTNDQACSSKFPAVCEKRMA